MAQEGSNTVGQSSPSTQIRFRANTTNNGESVEGYYLYSPSLRKHYITRDAALDRFNNEFVGLSDAFEIDPSTLTHHVVDDVVDTGCIYVPLEEGDATPDFVNGRVRFIKVFVLPFLGKCSLQPFSMLNEKPPIDIAGEYVVGYVNRGAWVINVIPRDKVWSEDGATEGDLAYIGKFTHYLSKD